MLRYFFVVLMMILGCAKAGAQEVAWPSPEVAQLYKNAKEHLSKGSINLAITQFRQAIQLAPDVMLLYRDLGQALNLAGNYGEAYAVLAPVIDKGRADEQTYQIAGAALTGARNSKKAKSVLAQGLERYPHSGLLYHELGRFYELNDGIKKAIEYWLAGIEKDPLYHLNYYEAARVYAGTDKPLWTILYGEIFVNMERQTNRSYDTRKMVLEAYGKVFKKIGSREVPAFGSNESNTEARNFEEAVLQVLTNLSPVVSDGMTTENLIMLRTRFLMDWQMRYGKRFPFSLFTYQDKLLREGQFEAYNNWFFGKTENEKQFESWQQFHPKAIPAFEQWAQQNKLRPTASDNYNPRDIGSLFPKKKR